MLNSSRGKSGYPPGLVPDLREKTFSLSPWSRTEGAGIVVGALYQVLKAPFYSWLAECFLHEWLLNFVGCFLCISWYDHGVLFLWYADMVDWLMDFWMLHQLCISGINPSRSWCIILLIYWIWFAITVSVWFWYQGNANLINWFNKCSFSSTSLKRPCRVAGVSSYTFGRIFQGYHLDLEISFL